MAPSLLTLPDFVFKRACLRPFCVAVSCLSSVVCTHAHQGSPPRTSSPAYAHRQRRGFGNSVWAALPPVGRLRDFGPLFATMFRSLFVVGSQRHPPASSSSVRPFWVCKLFTLNVCWCRRFAFSNPPTKPREIAFLHAAPLQLCEQESSISGGLAQLRAVAAPCEGLAQTKQVPPP